MVRLAARSNRVGERGRGIRSGGGNSPQTGTIPKYFKNCLKDTDLPRVKPQKMKKLLSSSGMTSNPKASLISVCALSSLAKHCLLCSPCWPYFHHHCAGGASAAATPVLVPGGLFPPGALFFQDKAEEAESSSELSPGLLELKGTKQGEAAAVATPSPSSDSERDLKPSPTKSTVGDSAVNTGSSCLEKPRLKNSARPEGKYWKRSHHKSHSSNS
ncbi:hypothetical protein DV515_00002501, partial [Chloebia gouldiae]